MMLNMIFKSLLSSATIATLIVAPLQARDLQSAPPPPPPVSTAPGPNDGSFYLQCDGNPNNMSAGEGLARVVGAVTLLGVFAKRVEQPDASKRKFGAAGVAACSALIDGEKGEGNVVRRLPLILGRALHQIEAKNYEAALADVAKARAEAAEAKLNDDPYFDRSVGVSFDRIEAQALIRAGKVDAAIAISMRPAERFPSSYNALIGAADFPPFQKNLPASAIERLRRLTRIDFLVGGALADRLAKIGQFEAAANVWRAVGALQNVLHPDSKVAWTVAREAVALALANRADAAKAAAVTARKTLTERADAGKPEPSAAAAIEILDLYEVIRLAKSGRLGEARTRYAARSEWTHPQFGEIETVVTLLRAGATTAEMVGPLQRSPDQLWRERRDRELAEILETDKDNRSLWMQILPYAQAPAYESLSKVVWNGAKSRWIADVPVKDTQFFRVDPYGAASLTQIDAMLLHCANVAQARGQEGMIFILGNGRSSGFVRFGNATDPEMDPIFFLNADSVIADLRTVIPPPDEVEARRRSRAQAEKR